MKNNTIFIAGLLSLIFILVPQVSFGQVITAPSTNSQTQADIHSQLNGGSAIQNTNSNNFGTTNTGGFDSLTNTGQSTTNPNNESNFQNIGNTGSSQPAGNFNNINNTGAVQSIKATKAVALPQASCGSITNFTSLVTCIAGLINAVIYLLIGIAVLLFIAGLVKYITAGGDEKQVTEAKNYILFGIIAIFVMVSVWGLVAILTNTFFSGGVAIPQLK